MEKPLPDINLVGALLIKKLTIYITKMHIIFEKSCI